MWYNEGAMFVRTKVFKNKDGSTRTYLQLVEGERIGDKVRQKVVATLGRLEELQAGELDRLIENLARFSTKQWVKLQARSLGAKWAKQWGPSLIFRRLWEELELSGILKSRLEGTQVQADFEEAVFAMVLNRLCDPRSKVGVDKWAKTVYRPQFEQLDLHHYYRALDFLAEEKNEIEVRLFDRTRDLFNLKLDLVFWDTTSTYFCGKGPEGLAQYGFSKDKRPDRLQLMVGLLMTKEGIPVAHQVFPGNTADIATFRAALEDLRERFLIDRVILVADRGMVDSKVLKELEEAKLQYIVGVKMRKLGVMRAVLGRPGRYHVVKENLQVKEVVHEGVRYIICLNPEEAEHDRRAREEMVAKLEAKLSSSGLKSLVGNTGYRRYLKVEGAKAGIDQDAIREEALYDGKYVLRTNTNLSPEEAALAYKGLWQVERAFRNLKSGLDLRPVYHWTDRRVRGHIMVCFLALVLEVVLQKKLEAISKEISYSQVMSDLAQLQAVEVHLDGQRYLARTELVGCADLVFKALGMRPPLHVDVLPSS